MPITKIQYGGRRHFGKRISPCLSRELSKFDEIWYANAYFDTFEETRTLDSAMLNTAPVNHS